MRWSSVLLAAGLTLAASTVQADEAWNGPGWYVIATQYAVILWSGPYASEDDCEQANRRTAIRPISAFPARSSIRPLNNSPDIEFRAAAGPEWAR